jgi:hypothetical protein
MSELADLLGAATAAMKQSTDGEAQGAEAEATRKITSFLEDVFSPDADQVEQVGWHTKMHADISNLSRADLLEERPDVGDDGDISKGYRAVMNGGKTGDVACLSDEAKDGLAYIRRTSEGGGDDAGKCKEFLDMIR